MHQAQPCFWKIRTTPQRQFRWTFVIPFLLSMLLPSWAFAQAVPIPSDSQKDLTVEDLKERLRHVEERHHSELSELKDRLEVVEKQQVLFSDDLAQKIKVGAYGAAIFEGFRNRRTTYSGNFELLISADLHDRIRAYAEIDLGARGEGVGAEQAYVDLLLTRAFNLRGGVLLIPFGKFNLDHFDPRRDLTRPPSVARLVTPTNWSDIGFSVFGFVPISENVKASYEIQVVNGLTDQFIATPGNNPDVGLRSARSELRADNNGDKAVVGRGTLKFFDQYEIGLSGYRGDYKTGSQDLITGIAFDTEFRPRNITFLENFVLRSEFARFDIQGSTTPSSLWGYYIQVTYRFWPSSLNSTILGRHFNNPTFALVGLYGRTKINTAASPTGSQTGEQYIIGFNYRPIEDYVFKMEYQFNSGQFNQFSSDGFLTSIAWIF